LEDLPRLPFNLAQSVSKKTSALVVLVFASFLLFFWFVLGGVARGFREFGFIVLEKTLTGVVQGPRHIIMVKTLWVQFD
jgi:hypothetical protein